MELFAVFATLPLALFSFFSRGRGAHAGIGFLAALAPVLGSLAGSIFNRKGAQSRQQNEIDYRRQQFEQQAAQQEAARRAAFEQRQGSPQAAMQRLGFNTRLSHLLGGFGGRGQTPGFILNAFDSARTPQEYQPGFESQFIAPPKTGGGIWDYLGDAGRAASYFDTSRFGQGGQGAAPPTGAPAPTAAPTGAAQGFAGLLPSSFRNREYAGLETPQFGFQSPEDPNNEFLRRRR